jgi:lipid-A-disaccharide synthase
MVNSNPRVVIVAGEASGDLHGALLAAGIRKLVPNAELSGIGGRRMSEAGVSLYADSSQWSGIGVVQSLKVIPKLWTGHHGIARLLKANPPNLLVLIDFGAFNTRLAAKVRSSRVQILYYIPPGSWSRKKRYTNLHGLVDRVITPFPWSAETLRSEGIEADFFGHPLLDAVKPELSHDEFCLRYKLDSQKPIVGLLPGSRTAEVIHMLPTMLVAGTRMMEANPDLQFVIPVAKSLDPMQIERELSQVSWLDAQLFADSPTAPTRMPKLPLARMIAAENRDASAPKARLPVRLLSGMTGEVLSHSRMAVLSSGTATLEGTILGVPMVIIYKGSRMMKLEYALIGRRIGRIGMPNILLDRMVCPELISDAANPEAIADLALPLIADSPERTAMIEGLHEARAMLGEPGAVEKSVRVIVEMLKGRDAG